MCIVVGKGKDEDNGRIRIAGFVKRYVIFLGFAGHCIYRSVFAFCTPEIVDCG